MSSSETARPPGGTEAAVLETLPRISQLAHCRKTQVCARPVPIGQKTVGGRRHGGMCRRYYETGPCVPATPPAPLADARGGAAKVRPAGTHVTGTTKEKTERHVCTRQQDGEQSEGLTVQGTSLKVWRFSSCCCSSSSTPSSSSPSPAAARNLLSFLLPSLPSPSTFSPLPARCCPDWRTLPR